MPPSRQGHGPATSTQRGTRSQRRQGLADYHRLHCGYLASIGFPPSWTGGSKVVGLAPGSGLELEVGMTFHAHSWFTNMDVADYFVSNTVLLGEHGAEVLTCETLQILIVR